MADMARIGSKIDNIKTAVEILRTYREQNCRQSQNVVDLWDTVIKKSIDKLGDEKYVIWEQVCICALDSNRIDIANECLLELFKKFPSSSRVRLLEELVLEFLEKYDEALELLDSMIQDDETNASPRKRKIAILKAKGRTSDAIKELNEYLKKFMIDQDAWNELCDLYLSEQEYAKAAFCMEELILQNPHNHLFHLRFAEIKYTLGGFDNLELALAYYCQALKLSPSNMRALFGLYLSAKHIAASPKCNVNKKKKVKEIIAWSLEQIQAQYDQVSESNPQNSITQSFKNLSFSDSK